MPTSFPSTPGPTPRPSPEPTQSPSCGGTNSGRFGQQMCHVVGLQRACCDERYRGHCAASCCGVTCSPVSAPTAQPSAVPSTQPSTSPTTSPTSSSPTTAPSTIPTADPTRSPTGTPTGSVPTYAPTSLPTVLPSFGGFVAAPTNPSSVRDWTRSPTTGILVIERDVESSTGSGGDDDSFSWTTILAIIVLLCVTGGAVVYMIRKARVPVEGVVLQSYQVNGAHPLHQVQIHQRGLDNQLYGTAGQNQIGHRSPAMTQEDDDFAHATAALEAHRFAHLQQLQMERSGARANPWAPAMQMGMEAPENSYKMLGGSQDSSFSLGAGSVVYAGYDANGNRQQLRTQGSTLSVYGFPGQQQATSSSSDPFIELGSTHAVGADPFEAAGMAAISETVPNLEATSST